MLMVVVLHHQPLETHVLALHQPLESYVQVTNIYQMSRRKNIKKGEGDVPSITYRYKLIAKFKFITCQVYL